MDKEDKKTNGVVNLVNNEERPDHGADELGGDLVDFEENINGEDGGDLYSPDQSDLGEFKDDVNLEPLDGMEFESHGEALLFYQEYARSMGFQTAIQNSRRSKSSREFIDAKFACSRYGTKRGNDKSANRPRSSQDPENGGGRRVCEKTDCKASMHVKRRSDGRWIIHRFEKEHNHELSLPQAVTEQTKRMYAAMARQLAEFKNVVGTKSDSKSSFERAQNLAMDAGEANILLEFFIQMQSMNSNFFYAVDVSEDHRLKNFLWVDAKSRHDYARFSDVVSFDATYVRNKYKIPLALFIGVNRNYQFVLLGTALLSDESSATLSWVMRTWLRAMGGRAPKAIVTDHEHVMTSVISEIFPSSLHFFCLGKVSESLKNVVMKQNEEEFMVKFEECIFGPWTDEEFEERWQNLVNTFELRENELLWSLYEERRKWVPTLMRSNNAAFLGESVNSFFDKYVNKETTLQEFVKQYGVILQDRYKEEAKADSDTTRYPPLAASGEKKCRVQRYNDLCQRAMRLSEEGSLSQERYTSALHALHEAYGNCVNLESSNKINPVGTLTSSTPGDLFVEGDNQTSKTNKKRSSPTKKRKEEPKVMRSSSQLNDEAPRHA
ncbi:PREDICTED: protein FAR-RED ELONGATED HYPOCOTYL 3-like [Ipomoea nil]|uniref:protein FAR-RED ELONGATED HYPOCOTYL 3-like n=1 Tax=Ipomoea nil TaxID=35883 RepID=UPI0009011458|nr:PREDICTED: protein FAR-RED ELONGATED HYPOCOTYL 3-like [Ipomoea nil]